MRREGALHLRFLGTVAAVGEMAARLGVDTESGWELMIGLVASRHRREVKAALEVEFLKHDRAINSLFLSVLAFIRLRPWLFISMPMPEEYPRLSEAGYWFYPRVAELYNDAFKAARRQAASDLVQAMATKSSAAREAGLNAILSIDPALLPKDETAAPSIATDAQTILNREDILSDLRQRSPKLHLRVLSDLPDSELPDLDTHFADRAAHHPWLFGHLLARYGTARALPSVRSVFESGHLRWDCDSRTPFLAYFLRVAPIDGARILRRSLNERENNGCFRFMLSSVARLHTSHYLEKIAVDSLYDQDPEVAADAARVLAEYGSVHIEAHLWRRLEHWTREWRDRDRELHGNRATGEGGQRGQARLGETLETAIAYAQAWRLNEQRRERLYSLCSDDPCRERWQQRPNRVSVVRISVHRPMYGQLEFEVGQYRPGTLSRLSQKISQFPPGTVFAWCSGPKHDGGLTHQDSLTALRQVSEIVQLQSFRLLESPSSKICSEEPAALP